MPNTVGAFPREGMDLWAPMSWDPDSRSKIGFRRAHWLRVAARLQPGISATEADAQLQTTVKRLQGLSRDQQGDGRRHDAAA